MVTKEDFFRRLLSEGGTYSSVIDPIAAEIGYSLPETMEEQSARKNPIVNEVAKAAMARPGRQVSVAQDFNPMAGNVRVLDDVAAGLNKMVTGGSPMDRLTVDPNDPYADNFMRESHAPVDLRAVESIPQAYNEEDKLNTFLSRVAGQTASAWTGANRFLLEHSGLGNVMPNALGMLEDLSKRAEKVQDTRTGYDTQTGAAIGEDAMNVGSSIAQMLMTGVTPYPLTAMGLMTAGQSYDANRNLGVSPGTAALAAGASGLAEGGFERIFGIGEGIQALKGALRNAGQTGLRNAAMGAGRGLMNIAAGEEPSEMMTTGVQGLTDRAVHPFHETGGMNQELLDTARVTAEQAGLLGLLGGGVNMAGRMANRRHNQQVEQQLAQRRALEALDPKNAQLYAGTPPQPTQPEQTGQNDFLSQVLSELEKIRRHNEMQVQARQVQRQRVEPREINLPDPFADLIPEKPNVPENVPADSTPIQAQPATEQITGEPAPEPAREQTPTDIIIANGGIRPDVLSKDLGWTDEEIAKLPQGVVTDDGKTLLPVKRALKKAGLDTDINAILDAASRPEAPEIDFAQEEARLMQQGNQPVVEQPVVQEKANSTEEMYAKPERETPYAKAQREMREGSRRISQMLKAEIAKYEAAKHEAVSGMRSDQPTKGKQLDTVTSSENATSGNRIDQKKYFTAKDSSFVAVVDTGSTKPVMTAIGKNGETKEIPVGKHVEQMVQDGRLKRISKKDFEAWQKDEGGEPSKNTKPVPVDVARTEERADTGKQPAQEAQQQEKTETTLPGGMKSEVIQTGETEPVSEAVAEQSKIEDSGRKIRARKDEYAFLETMRKDAGDGDLSLSRHFPEPNYAALIESGVSEGTLAVFKMIRDEVPAKPKYPSSRWAANFRLMRDLAAGIVDGKVRVEDVVSKIGNGRYKLALYRGVGYPGFTKIKRLGYNVMRYGEGYVVLHKSLIEKRCGTLEDAIDEIRKRIANTGAEESAKSGKRPVKLDIFRVRGKDGTNIGKVLSGQKYVVLKDGFKNSAEAAEYLSENREVLEKQWEALKKDPAVRRDENLPRAGKDRRGGKDVTQKQFMETFGFSGDTYGNWVTQKERQDFLNNTYDALMDLSDVLGISSKAISLNGELGIQFGASGRAGANAHYRRNDVSINLTRKKGAGSLAHEWFHALDNYFSRMAGRGDGMITEARGHVEGVRKEMQEAFRKLQGLLVNGEYTKRSEKMDSTRTDAYWGTVPEKGARAFESYIITKAQGLGVTNDFLANIVGEDAFSDPERYPYPTGEEKAEIDKAFDRLFDTIQEKETEQGIALFSREKSENADTKEKGMSVDDLRLLADELAGTFHNAPGIVVADSPQDAIPDALPDGMGLFDPNNGKVFLFARNIRDADTARAVFAHEVIAHYGLRGFFGDSLGDVLVSIRNHNPKIEKFSQEWWSENQDYIKQVRENEGRNWTEEQFEKWQRDISIEEAMAFFAEPGERITGVKRLVRKIQELLRDITRRLGWRWPTNLANWLESKTDAEALSALHQAGLFVRGDISGQTVTTRGDIAKYRVRKNEEARTGVFDVAESFAVPQITILDNIIRAMQDKDIDIKRVQDSILESGGTISENTDVYLNETLYTSRMSDRLRRLNEDWTKPILEAVQKSGLTIDEAGDWLYARHVVEDGVNAKLAEINPDREDNDALSGMSDGEAHDILERNSGNKALEELGELSDKLARRNVMWLVNGGLITKEEAKAWAEKYKHYVPLKRDSDIPEKQGFVDFIKNPLGSVSEKPTRRGKVTGTRNLDTRGKESKHRLGGKRRATNIIANMMANATTTIMRTEKAIVGRSMLDLARANPNPELWTVDTPNKVKRINRETGLVEVTYRDLGMVPADNVLVVKENGVEHWIKFNEENPRALAMAQSMKGLDAAAMNWLTQSIGATTRYMARWITSRNPVFMLFNFQRDIQHAVFNLSDTPISGKEGQVLKNILPAMRQYHNMLHGDGEKIGYADEFREAGAETGFVKTFESIHDHVKDLQKELDKMNRSKAHPMVWIEKTVTLIDDYNNIVENGVRLAVYTVARENGQTIRQAAKIAKEITVDFNRRGTRSSLVNSLWMFTNASIQGHARLIRALVRSKKARIMAAGLIGIGFVMDIVGRALMGDDDETGLKVWDEISEFDKERNWIIPAPWSKEGYIKVPLPQGLHVLPNIGRMLSELCFSSRKKDPLEMALRAGLLIVDAFNPFGAAASPGQFIAPTIAKPFVQLWENRSFAGQKIYRDDTAYSGYTPPAYQRAWSNTPGHWTKLSKMLNDVAGGDDVKGKINVPPEAIRLIVNSYLLPGTSGNLDKLTGALQKDDTTSKDWPVLSRMYGSAPDEKVQERAVYERLGEIRNTVNAIREYKKQERWNDARKLVKELGDGDIRKGNRILDGYDGFTYQLKEMNRDKRMAEKEKDANAIREINAKRKRLFTRFLSSRDNF